MQHKQVKLIMVEDDLMLCEGWSEIFEFFGYQAKFFHTARALFADADAIADCNVLMSDFYLPDLNGIEITEKIRKLRSDLPVILLTGSREPAIIQGVSKIPQALLLFKPLNMDDLARAIDKIMFSDAAPRSEIEI